ncbi:uncharacterized protein RJT21DRAFT_122886 [Scheffersomyces amazonensis]|uniref:uncharacterized protein n=1 Tax=Scheffersomyces amazonensis TaxID=1078765 RepID=UPI00315DA513
MRKIWNSRRDREKRRSLSASSTYEPSINDSESTTVPEYYSYIGEEDYSLPHESSTTTNTTNTPDTSYYSSHKHSESIVSTNSSSTSTTNRTSGAIVATKSIQSLIKPDYDTKVIKNGWLNVILNTQSNDVQESALKLFRVELKGSNLYMYKPPSSVNAKCFRLVDSEDPGSPLPAPPPQLLNHNNNSSASLSSGEMYRNHNTSTSNVSFQDMASPILQTATTYNNINGPVTATPTTASTSTPTNDDFSLTYLDTRVPHPNLSYDMSIHQFSSSIICIDQTSSATINSIESILHFILFSTNTLDEPCIESIINILPILPDFGKILKLLTVFISSLLDEKFQGAVDLPLIISRVLRILYNIEQNFDGFLLKSTIAPYILNLIEILTHDDKIAVFKRSMLAKQQLLINLVNSRPPPPPTEFNSGSVVTAAASVTATTTAEDGIIDPFQDLNAATFMKDINLIELVKVISAIDLKFFNNWNSNIDKSLLLSTSIGDSSASPTSITPSITADFYKKNPLIFNNDHHIHYLSRLLVNHLFVENSHSSSSTTLERKARLLEKWIDLGCLLDKSGNMSSWLGISSIILSQPVLRLTKIWSLVSPEYIKLLKNDWSPVLFELDRRHLANNTIVSSSTTTNTTNSSPNDSSLASSPQASRIKSGSGSFGEESRESSVHFKDSYHIMAPRGLGKIYPKEKVIPYFGDLVINNNLTTTTTTTKAKAIDMFELESIWKRINYSFNRWNEYLSNLINYDDIIRYNEDVLRRYDNMGFIFSNESLNQVLYLGVNNEDTKPPSHELTELDGDRDVQQSLSLLNDTEESSQLTAKLLRLIDINCDSINLDKIMKLSINLEPDLPEAYLKLPTTTSVIPSTPLELSFLRNRKNSASTASLESVSTVIEPPTTPTITSSFPTTPTTSTFGNGGDFNPGSRLPTFNNNYFKINLAKYDELTAYYNNDDKMHLQQLLDPTTSKHNFIIDEDLTFRIDDFIVDQMDSPVNTNTSISSTLDDIDNVDFEDDIPGLGLGIDVDDILNSDKFNNFAISPKTMATVNPKKYGPEASIKLQRLSQNSHERPMKFIPKYATIDRLIDLFLIDSKYFHEDINLDLTEYRFVFLLNYTSFISTKDLLEKLAHRFINSGNAVISVMKKDYYTKQAGQESIAAYLAHAQFPNWNLDNSIDLNELGQVDYELLLKIQINILKALIVLVNNFYSYFSLDLTNKRILIKLLKLFSNEILQWYNSNKIVNHLEKSFESLVTYYKKLKKLFVKKTYRPIEISKFDEYLIKEFRFNNSLGEVPMNRNLPSHKNVLKIEKFLHKFNKLLAVFYKGIRAEDWIRVYRILENAFENNNLLEFNLQKVGTADEAVVISNIFNYFETLIDPSERQLILKKFPLVFRKLFKLYFKFRTYLLSQLTDLNISIDERLDRMKTLLIMGEISKLKMSENQFVFEGRKGNIPSCIETAITNVIYAPESRMFSSLWIKSSNSLTGSSSTIFEDLDQLLPKTLTMVDLQNPEPLLPCFGWIIENLIETNKCPSFFKNCINFNKRYLIFKLIREVGVEDFDSNDPADFNHYDSKDFEFLLKLNESIVKSANIKEFVTNERDRSKFFKSTLMVQHKILQADNRKKQLKEGAKNGLANLNPNHTVTLNKKTSNSSIRRQSLSYKSNSTSRFKISGLFNKSRPFSLNGISGSERIIDISELPDADSFSETKSKPYMVIPLRNKKIFPVYLLPVSFKVDSDNSNLNSSSGSGSGSGSSSNSNSQESHFFQALNENDSNDWLVKLNYANRHWFFSKSITGKVTSNNHSNHSNLVFGIPISIVCIREQSSCPRFLTSIFEEIESEGIKDVGVYRISSSISELNNIKGIIDRTGGIDFKERSYDVHALTSIVKSYFRELPDAILTDKVIEEFFDLKQQTKDVEIDEGKLIEKYREILKLLPNFNYSTIKILLNHLQKITQFSDDNKMTSSNLATVIGPALTEASSLEALVNNFGFMNSILDKLICNYELVFEQ